MQCREFREIADSYLSNELIVETNHVVISHLERCAECRHELAARRELRNRLRAAFIHAPENQMRPGFADCLTTQMRDYALGKRTAPIVSQSGWRSGVTLRRTSWLALAACLFLAAGFGLVLVRHWMLEPSPQQGAEEVAGPALTNDPARLNPEIPVNISRIELAKSAAGDHRDCAIHFRLSEKPIDLSVAGQKYDPVYISLTRAVMSQHGDVPLGAEFVEAHSCVFEGRRFAHIVLRYHGRLVSFLVTDLGRREEGKADTARAVAAPQVMACSQFDGYQVSCFETPRRAVFIVSDLKESDNLELARALAPSVFAHITRTENGA